MNTDGVVRPDAAQVSGPFGRARRNHRRVFIIAACLVPSILSAALLIARFQSLHQSDVQRDALLTARTLSQTVDRELKTCLLVAQTLARSTHLETGDLAAFDEQARMFLRDEFPGFNFVLVNGDSVQIVNTIRPLGAPLPDPGSAARVRQVFATGQPIISDVFIGGAIKRPVMSVSVPVWRQGKVVYSLAVGVLPSRLGEALLAPHPPNERVIELLDAKGVVAARTQQSERYVGQGMSSAFVSRIQNATDGMFEMNSLDGVPVFAVFNRSIVTGWTVVIGVPTTSVLHGLLGSFGPTLLVVLMLLFTGTALVVYLTDIEPG